jgi:hypothetical protein
VKAAVVAGLPLGRQHFFRIVCGCPKGLFDPENFGKLFLSFFVTIFAGNRRSRKPETQTGRMPQRAIDALRKKQSMFRKMALKLEVAHASALALCA